MAHGAEMDEVQFAVSLIGMHVRREAMSMKQLSLWDKGDRSVVQRPGIRVVGRGALQQLFDPEAVFAVCSKLYAGCKGCVRKRLE